MMLLGMCGVSCSTTDARPAQLLVKVRAEAGLAARLTRVQASLYAPDASDGASATREQRFALTADEPTAERVRLPFSFGVSRGNSDEILLVVRGFEGADADAQPVVEHKQRARFGASVTQVEVALTDDCADHACASLGETCGAAGRCVLVATGEPAEAGTPPTAAVAQQAKTSTNAGASAGAGRRSGPSAGTAGVDVPRPPANEAGASAGAPAKDDDAGTPPAACEPDNACKSLDYPCVAGLGGSYTCQGQLADWPMPDSQPGAKATPSYNYQSDANLVEDRVTGLVWQRAVPTRYPGCSGNVKAPGDSCTWTEAKRYCQQLSLSGADWRLPSKIELESILGDTDHVPPADLAAFPDLSVTHVFWTSSSVARMRGLAWTVRSGLGVSLFEEQTMARNVRCVRGGNVPPGEPSQRYELGASEDTITDLRTKLTWKRTYADADSIDAARAHCAALDGGYRLPSVKELLTLIDPTRSEPAIVPIFPAIPLGGMFWSATEMVTRDGQYVVVDFAAGVTSPDQSLRDSQDSVRFTFHARCVR